MCVYSRNVKNEIQTVFFPNSDMNILKVPTLIKDRRSALKRQQSWKQLKNPKNMTPYNTNDQYTFYHCSITMYTGLSLVILIV